jgi:hypothetical protein
MRRNRIPNTPLCAVVPCFRFDTAPTKCGDMTLPICRKHRKDDVLIVQVGNTINKITKTKKGNDDGNA